ncbi:MAG: ABC transporter substrate-binding protein [Pseudomonadota bacterium]
MMLRLNHVRRWMFVLVVMGASSTAFASDDVIAATMEGKLEELLGVIASGQSSTAVDAVLQSTVDYGSITRGVLGKHRSKLSDDQISRFQNEFQQSMQSLLIEALADIGEFELKMGKVKRRDNTRAQVFAEVRTERNETFDIASSVSSESGTWMVRNLIVNGVNLGLTYRNQFDQLMQTTGDPEVAIDRWRDAVEDSAE